MFFPEFVPCKECEMKGACRAARHCAKQRDAEREIAQRQPSPKHVQLMKATSIHFVVCKYLDQFDVPEKIKTDLTREIARLFP